MRPKKLIFLKKREANQNYLKIFKNLCKKHRVKLSDNYIEIFLELLEKNCIYSIQDLFTILKNSSYKDKLLSNYKLPLIDSLKFKKICKKEFDSFDSDSEDDTYFDLVEDEYEDSSLESNKEGASEIIDDIKKNCLKEKYIVNDRCFDIIKNSLEKNRIFSLSDFKLLMGSDKYEECVFDKDNDSKNKRNSISVVDKIKLNKVLEKYYVTKEDKGGEEEYVKAEGEGEIVV